MVDNRAFSQVRGHLVVLAMSTVGHRLAHRGEGSGDDCVVVHRSSTGRRATVHTDAHTDAHTAVHSSLGTGPAVGDGAHRFLIRWMSSVTWS